MKGNHTKTPDFRHEVFMLCKSLQKNDCAKQLGSCTYNLSVCSESKETGQINKNSHGDFAYLAQHSNTEFHGFLFLDDNMDIIQIPPIFKAEHLSNEERILFERGHKTLTRFVELCLSDIMQKNNTVAESMNPYFLYKEVTLPQSTQSFLSDEEFSPAVAAFKNGTAYKALMNSDFTILFEKVDISAMRSVVGVTQHELSQSLGENITKDLKTFSLNLDTKLHNITDITFAVTILMIALKESLKLSCHLLYRAICGVDLFVLNNDNIINIEKRTSTVISEFFKVFAQDLPFDYTGSEMGSILLIDCDLPYDEHLHEFGMIIAETMNLEGEFGQTTKYSFVTVDKELIYIHHLTKDVLRNGLPKFIAGNGNNP